MPLSFIQADDNLQQLLLAILRLVPTVEDGGKLPFARPNEVGAGNSKVYDYDTLVKSALIVQGEEEKVNAVYGSLLNPDYLVNESNHNSLVGDGSDTGGTFSSVLSTNPSISSAQVKGVTDGDKVAALVLPFKTTQYLLKAKLTSETRNDGTIGIVVATDNNGNSLSFVRNAGSDSESRFCALVYNYGEPSQVIIESRATSTYPVLGGGNGWRNQVCSVAVHKYGNKVTVLTSEIGSGNMNISLSCDLSDYPTLINSYFGLMCNDHVDARIYDVNVSCGSPIICDVDNGKQYSLVSESAMYAETSDYPTDYRIYCSPFNGRLYYNDPSMEQPLIAGANRAAVEFNVAIPSEAYVDIEVGWLGIIDPVLSVTVYNNGTGVLQGFNIDALYEGINYGTRNSTIRLVNPATESTFAAVSVR